MYKLDTDVIFDCFRGQKFPDTGTGVHTDMPVSLPVLVIKFLSLDALDVLCCDRFVLLIRIFKDFFQSFRDLMLDLATPLSFHVIAHDFMMQEISTLIGF